MIDLEKLAEQHKKLFPNATAESQLWKMEEELKELEEAKSFEDIMKETADVIIVCGGLYRWCPFIASIIRQMFYIDEETEAEINRKWQINLKRKWEWNGKTYHHVE